LFANNICPKDLISVLTFITDTYEFGENDLIYAWDNFPLD